MRREGIRHEVETSRVHRKVWVYDPDGRRHLMIMSEGGMSDRSGAAGMDIGRARAIAAGRVLFRGRG